MLFQNYTLFLVHHYYSDVRFEVFTVMKIRVTVSCVVMQSTDVAGHQRFRKPSGKTTSIVTAGFSMRWDIGVQLGEC